MPAEFISEPISPVGRTFDRSGMTMGEPGLPGRFVWRGAEYEVTEVLEKWKETGPMKGGGAGSELYVRKHWFRIRTTDGREMKLYFERQARSARRKKQRWWLYTITVPAS